MCQDVDEIPIEETTVVSINLSYIYMYIDFHCTVPPPTRNTLDNKTYIKKENRVSIIISIII